MGGFSNLLASLGWFFWWVVWFFCDPRGVGTGLGLDLGLVPVGLSIWFWFGPHSPPLVWFILFGSGSAAGLLGSLGCNIFLMVNWPRFSLFGFSGLLKVGYRVVGWWFVCCTGFGLISVVLVWVVLTLSLVFQGHWFRCYVG